MRSPLIAPVLVCSLMLPLLAAPTAVSVTPVWFGPYALTDRTDCDGQGDYVEACVTVGGAVSYYGYKAANVIEVSKCELRWRVQTYSRGQWNPYQEGVQHLHQEALVGYGASRHDYSYGIPFRNDWSIPPFVVNAEQSLTESGYANATAFPFYARAAESYTFPCLRVATV